jgi:hypothetical protein
MKEYLASAVKPRIIDAAISPTITMMLRDSENHQKIFRYTTVFLLVVCVG